MWLRLLPMTGPLVGSLLVRQPFLSSNRGELVPAPEVLRQSDTDREHFDFTEVPCQFWFALLVQHRGQLNGVRRDGGLAVLSIEESQAGYLD